jgi:serine/threonine protein kinase
MLSIKVNTYKNYQWNQIDDQIGSGSTACVYRGINKVFLSLIIFSKFKIYFFCYEKADGKYIAVKIIDSSLHEEIDFQQPYKSRLVRELKTHQNFDHENVVKILDCFVSLFLLCISLYCTILKKFEIFIYIYIYS